MIRDFIELLDILYQNPTADLRALLQSDTFSYAKPSLEQQSDAATDPRFAEFSI